MVSERAYQLGAKRSAIRDVFEYGRARAALVGRENVFDLSLGNPSVPPPEEVTEALCELLSEEPLSLHGYTSAPGGEAARDAIAASLNRRFGTSFTRDNLYLTCGAAAALTSCFSALTIDRDTEFIAIKPYFPEYDCFAATSGARLVSVPADLTAFQIDFCALEAAITPRTQAVVINSPNNPSGAVYSEETLLRLCKLLTEKSQAFGRPVYLISDEPYRELYYGKVAPPFVTRYYDNTLVCYSFSKSLSLPGERIGYVLIPSEAEDHRRLSCAVAGAARSLGYVCAPTLMQRVVGRCADVPPDLTAYRKNRDLLYGALTGMGYRCVEPQGAFYLFVEAPGGNAAAFCERAKALDLLLVPGDSFGCPTHLRASYCVSYDTIERSLPLFQALIG